MINVVPKEDAQARRALIYLAMAAAYSERSMRCPSDGLKAFDGILQHLLANGFEGGFFWGLPIQRLSDALAWQHVRRGETRKEFPSWCWASQEGKPVPYGTPSMASGFGANDQRDTATWQIIRWQEA
jgi:hypothetical protein